MRRRDKVTLGVSLLAFASVAVLFSALAWLLWRDSMALEKQIVGGLALALGERTERILLDTRDLLERFDQLEHARCSEPHLRALQDAAMSRPYLRAIGYWRAAERMCGVGFLPADGLKPPRADRIYDNGLLAWWPSEYTEIGGVRLFLMRLGDHDAAIDPGQLLDIGPFQQRQAGLWVEGLRLVSQPTDADLPAPEGLPVGVSIDQVSGRVISRFTHRALLPIDVVAIEPLASFWQRHLRALAVGSGIGLALVGGWLFVLLRYTRRQLSMVAELREAIALGRIQTRYQPVIELASRRCVGAEALARWTREDGDPVPPDVFIPAAENEGLVPEITLAMLDNVLADLPRLRQLAPGLSVNLNLSPDDLKSERFGQRLAESLRKASLPAGAIKLEITERALVNSETARGMIKSFRANGHQIAIDDFGTGYSSLSYLQSFELDVLKIDKTFVDAIGTEAATSQVIVHVIEMARSLGLDTVAEGVQSEEQVSWLLQHGVGQAQGYLFAAPMNAIAFADMLREQARDRPHA